MLNRSHGHPPADLSTPPHPDRAKQLLANTNAETLLTAEENSSEGRRRAVALNNMLFSSSLFTATEHGGPVRRELLLVDPTEGKDLLF